jgi:hypothetical protein
VQVFVVVDTVVHPEPQLVVDLHSTEADVAVQESPLHDIEPDEHDVVQVVFE